jgi:hypothetical protein
MEESRRKEEGKSGVTVAGVKVGVTMVVCRFAGVPSYRCVGLPVCRCAGIPVFQRASMQGCRCAGRWCEAGI